MFEKPIKITSFDVFPNGTVKPSALLKYMQQIAREDCDAVGCTYPFIRSLNTVFVVTKLGIELDRPLVSGETITIRTYNNRINGIVFDREYEFLSDGEEIGHCSSSWVLVRYDTRALVRPKDFPFEFVSYEKDCRLVDVPRRLDDEGCVPSAERVVRVSDLDENNHLNNCIYADIALDAVTGFDGLSEAVTGVTVIFRNEAKLGDVLQTSERRGDGNVFVKAYNQTTDKPCFEALFTFSREAPAGK